jgi:hypothetical protein
MRTSTRVPTPFTGSNDAGALAVSMSAVALSLAVSIAFFRIDTLASPAWRADAPADAIAAASTPLTQELIDRRAPDLNDVDMILSAPTWRTR